MRLSWVIPCFGLPSLTLCLYYITSHMTCQYLFEKFFYFFSEGVALKGDRLTSVFKGDCLMSSLNPRTSVLDIVIDQDTCLGDHIVGLFA